MPYGYRRVFEDGKAVSLEVDGAAAAVVQRIFAERATGMTLRAIADTLNVGALSPGVGIVGTHPVCAKFC